MSPAVQRRALSTRNRLLRHSAIDAAHAALVVVDMQNHFVAEGYPGEVPASRTIIDAINRMASSMRRAGGLVVWIQTTASGAQSHWEGHLMHNISSGFAALRQRSLDENSAGFRLHPRMDAEPADTFVRKIHYSALAPNGSDLEAVLDRHGIETLLICGTATNVCCESTARDAMMLNYRVVMLSDGCATWTDREHRATLDTFAIFFGDVMTVDQAAAMLVAAGAGVAS